MNEFFDCIEKKKFSTAVVKPSITHEVYLEQMLENSKGLGSLTKTNITQYDFYIIVDMHRSKVHLISLVLLMRVGKYLNVLKHFQNVRIRKT